MRAAVLHRPRALSIEDVPCPAIEQVSDAIVRVTSSAPGGSDLTIYNGLVPTRRPVLLGHEFMGVVVDTGPAVQRIRPGARVAIPSVVACGACWFCRQDLVTHCENSNDNYGHDGGHTVQRGGGRFGYTELYGGYPGGHAEYVRVPYVDFGARHVPDALSDDEALVAASTFAAGYAACHDAGMRPGDVVAVIGCGAVGIMAMKAAWLFGASKVFGIDRIPHRLGTAQQAASVVPLDDGKVDAVDEIRAATAGRGADVVIEAAGMSDPRVNPCDALATAIRVVRRAGSLVLLGDYFGPNAQLPLATLYDKSVRVRSGQVQIHHHIDECLRLVESGLVRADDVVTHRLELGDVSRAYDMLDRKEDGCVKVVLKH